MPEVLSTASGGTQQTEGTVSNNTDRRTKAGEKNFYFCPTEI